MLVPEVLATAVPETIELLTPFTTKFPVPAGNVIVFVPATAGADNEIAPDVSPEIAIEAMILSLL
jgi:hypothetical protein